MPNLQVETTANVIRRINLTQSDLTDIVRLHLMNAFPAESNLWINATIRIFCNEERHMVTGDPYTTVGASVEAVVKDVINLT